MNTNGKSGKSGANRRNKGRKRGANRQNNSVAVSHPPQIRSYGLTHDVRLRFQSTGAINTVITYENLLDAINVATTAVTAFQLFAAAKLRMVELWATPVTGAPVTVEVAFTGFTTGALGDQKQHTDTSMGIEPAHVVARPDPLTQAGQFQGSSTDNVFTLVCPTGTVIDVLLSYRNPIDSYVLAVQNAPAAATAGVVYYRGLDGKAAAATTIPVVGVLSVD